MIRNFSGFSTKDVALVHAAVEAAAAGNLLPAHEADDPQATPDSSRGVTDDGATANCIPSLSGSAADERGDLRQLAQRLIFETLRQSKRP